MVIVQSTWTKIRGMLGLHQVSSRIAIGLTQLFTTPTIVSCQVIPFLGTRTPFPKSRSRSYRLYTWEDPYCLIFKSNPLNENQQSIPVNYQQSSAEKKFIYIYTRWQFQVGAANLRYGPITRNLSVSDLISVGWDNWNPCQIVPVQLNLFLLRTFVLFNWIPVTARVECVWGGSNMKKYLTLDYDPNLT